MKLQTKSNKLNFNFRLHSLGTLGIFSIIKIKVYYLPNNNIKNCSYPHILVNLMSERFIGKHCTKRLMNVFKKNFFPTSLLYFLSIFRTHNATTKPCVEIGHKVLLKSTLSSSSNYQNVVTQSFSIFQYKFFEINLRK